MTIGAASADLRAHPSDRRRQARASEARRLASERAREGLERRAPGQHTLQDDSLSHCGSLRK